MHGKLRPTASVDSSLSPTLSPIHRVRAAPKSDLKYAILSIHDRLKRIITRVLEQVRSHSRPQAFDEVVTDLLETASRLETDLQFALTVPWASHSSGSIEYQNIAQALDTAKRELLGCFPLAGDQHKVQAEVWEVFAWLNGKLFQELCRNKGDSTEKEKLLGFVSRLHEDKQAMNQRLADKEEQVSRLQAQLEASLRVREEAEALNRDLAQANDEVEERIQELRQDYAALKEALLDQPVSNPVTELRLESELQEAKSALLLADQEESALLAQVSTLTEDLNDLRSALDRTREEKEDLRRREVDRLSGERRLHIEQLRGIRVEPDSAVSTANALQIASLSSELQTLKSRHLAEIQALSSSLASRNEENRQLQRDLAGYEEAISRLESAIAASKDRESTERALRQDTEARAGEASRELGLERAGAKALAAELQKLQEESSALGLQYTAVQADCQALRASIARATTVERQAKEDMAFTQSAYEKSTTDLLATIDSLKSREAALETTVRNLEIALKSKETDIKFIVQEKESDLKTANLAKHQFQLALSQHTAETANMQVKLSQSQGKCEEITREKTDIEGELATKKAESAELRMLIDKLHREKARDQEALSKLKADFSSKSALVTDLETAQLAADAQVRDFTTALQSLETTLKDREETVKQLNSRLQQASEGKERLENEIKRKFTAISDLEDRLRALERKAAVSASLWASDCEASNRELMGLEQDRSHFLSLTLSLHSQLTTLLQSAQWQAAAQLNPLLAEVQRLGEERETYTKKWEMRVKEEQETVRQLKEEMRYLTETVQEREGKIRGLEGELHSVRDESEGTITELRDICAELTLKLDAEKAAKPAAPPARISEDIFVLDSDPSDPQASSRHVTGSLLLCKKTQYQGTVWCLVSDYAESPEYMWVREADLPEGIEGGEEDEERKMKEMLGEMRAVLEEAKNNLQVKEEILADCLSLVHTAVPMDLSLDLPAALQVLLAFLPNQDHFQPIPATSLQPSELEICNEDRNSSLHSSFLVESPALSDTHSDMGTNPLPPEEAHKLLTALKEYERENRRLEATSELQENQLKLLKDELKGKFGERPVAAHVIEAVLALARSLPDM